MYPIDCRSHLLAFIKFEENSNPLGRWTYNDCKMAQSAGYRYRKNLCEIRFFFSMC